MGDTAGARAGAWPERPPHVGLRDRAGGREPRALRRDPRRLWPRRLEERLRRRHGREEAEGGMHRAGDEGARGARPAGRRPGGRRHRARSQDGSVHLDAVQLGHAAGRAEPVQAGRAADQELHDQRHRHGHVQLGAGEAARELRPPRAPVQRLRHAPLPHPGDPRRTACG